MILAGVITKLLGINNHIYALIKKNNKRLVVYISNCNTISITVAAAGWFSQYNTQYDSTSLCEIEMAHKQDPVLIYYVIQNLNHSNYQTSR